MSAGDLHFYRATSGRFSLAEWLIRLRTGRPYVHVGIEMGDGSEMQALARGVVRTKLQSAASPADIYPTSHYVNSQRMRPALDWLAGQVGDEYAFAEIADDALPSWWRILLKPKRAFTCSSLAAQFLLEAGLVGTLGELADTPELATPNSLARACGLLI